MHTVDAALANPAVFCEKPMGLTVEEIDRGIPRLRRPACRKVDPR